MVPSYQRSTQIRNPSELFVFVDVHEDEILDALFGIPLPGDPLGWSIGSTCRRTATIRAGVCPSPTGTPNAGNGTSPRFSLSGTDVPVTGRIDRLSPRPGRTFSLRIKQHPQRSLVQSRPCLSLVRASLITSPGIKVKVRGLPDANQTISDDYGCGTAQSFNSGRQSKVERPAMRLRV